MNYLNLINLMHYNNNNQCKTADKIIYKDPFRSSSNPPINVSEVLTDIHNLKHENSILKKQIEQIQFLINSNDWKIQILTNQINK